MKIFYMLPAIEKDKKSFKKMKNFHMLPPIKKVKKSSENLGFFALKINQNCQNFLGGRAPRTPQVSVKISLEALRPRMVSWVGKYGTETLL